MGLTRRRTAAVVSALCLWGAGLVGAGPFAAGAAPTAEAEYAATCRRGGDAATDVLLSVRPLPLTVGVAGTAPAAVGPDDGSMAVEFSWSIEIDGADPEVAYLWDLIGADSVTAEVVDVTMPVVVSGAGTTATDVTGTPPDGPVTFVKGEPTFITGGPFAAELPVTGSAGDQIFFAVGDPRLTVRMTLPGASAPIDLVLACGVGRLFATTAISVDGAPVIESVDRQVDVGGTLTLDVNDLITAGDGPLIPGSLEISEPPAEGTTSLSDTNMLTYAAPDADTEVWIGLRACGEPVVGTEPGDALCGAGTVKIALGTGISAPPGLTPAPPGPPTPGVQATDDEPAPAQPAPAPAAAPVTAQPSFTG